MKGNKYMYVAYICSPFKAETETELDNHIEYAQHLTRLALEAGLAPITPHLYITQVTDENQPIERQQGLAAGAELLKKCDVVITGNKYGISEGMAAELMIARDEEILILNGCDEATPEEIADVIGRVMGKPLF